MGRLAIDGGKPVTQEPFPTWPVFADDERVAVDEVLRSGKVNYWTGDTVDCFEQEFANHHDMPHAIAVANGTLALVLGLYALGIGPDDDVLVPSRTFVATASAVMLLGARPVFADVDRESGNVTPETLSEAITPTTRAIVVVHLGGWPCDMPAIMSFAHKHNLKVVEDCAQAHGAMVDQQRVGSFGDAAAFSFCQDKIISTGGEGGVLLCRDDDVWNKAWAYKDHGKNRELLSAAGPGDAFPWPHTSLGSNYRLTGLQAAIGRKQLAKLGEWVERRRANAGSLLSAWSELQALRCPWPGQPHYHAAYKLHVFLRPEQLRSDWSRDRVLAAVRAEGVPCFAGTCSEIYREQVFSEAGFTPSARQIAAELGATSLMFPVHPTMGSTDMERIALAVNKVMREATG